MKQHYKAVNIDIRREVFFEWLNRFQSPQEFQAAARSRQIRRQAKVILAGFYILILGLYGMLLKVSVAAILEFWRK